MPNYTITHGHTRNYRSTPTWRSWSSMRQRCTNKNLPHYRHYGGRGITVCERWSVFENFLADMGERPHGTSIDRIDKDGNYEPGNCRWASNRQQQVNSRNARMLTYQGETMCITDWAKRLGLLQQGLSERLKVMSVEEALSHPKTYGSPSKITAEQAKAIHSAKGTGSASKVAARFPGATAGIVAAIWAGRSWKFLGSQKHES